MLPSLVHENQKRSAEAARINEVARVANSLQKQGMSRTEALKAAEALVPHR